MTNAAFESLPAPIVVLSSDGMLDPDLVERYLEIEVPTSALLVPSARCALRLSGGDAQGTEVDWEYEDELFIGHDGEGLWYYCPKDIVESLRNGTAVFRYTIAPAAQSMSLVLGIGQPAAPGPLPPPVVADLVRDVVDSSLPRLLVTIPTSFACLRDAMATLTLRTDDSPLLLELARVLEMAPPVRAKDVVEETKRILDDMKAVPFTFRGYPPAHDGQEVDASYEILSPDGTTTSSSESTIFRIGLALGLNEPFIEEADGDVLNIDSFNGDAHIKTDPNEHIVAGLYYWAYLVSEGSGEPVYHPVSVASQVTQAEADRGLRIPIPREILDLLPADSTLRVQIAINLTGANDPFDSVDFPEKTYTVTMAERVSWDLEDLVPEQIIPIRAGQTLRFPLMDVVFVSAGLDPGSNHVAVERFAYSAPGYYSGVVFYIGNPTKLDTNNLVRLDFKQRWTSARFGLTSLDKAVTVTWITETGRFPQNIPGGNPTAAHEAKFAGDGIIGAEIAAHDGIRLDCFEFIG